MTTHDVIVVGGGLVGAAIAYGLARHHGARTLMLDEGDIALRASRGNFGLVWVQGKGYGLPPYARWTIESAAAWPNFAADLCETTGIDVDHQRRGGVTTALDEAALVEDQARMDDIAGQIGAGAYPYDVLDPAGLRQLLPRLGPHVVGGIHCPLDGCADPLKLLHALHAGFVAHGGTYRPRSAVHGIRLQADSVVVESDGGPNTAAKLVLAAGLGTTGLAARVGLTVPLRPVHGQLMVTERTVSTLDIPTVTVRQTREGSILIGSSSDEIGPTTATTLPGLAAIARDAVRTFPFLAGLRIVRTWAALRIMSPDGFPIYDTAPGQPHITAAACHSGVTLAAVHATRVPAWILGTADAPDLSPFHGARFDVSTAA